MNRLVGADNPKIEGLLYGSLDRWVVMAQQRGPVRHAHIHIATAIQVVNPRPVAVREVERVAERPVGAGGGAHPAGQVGLGERIVLLHTHHVTSL